MTSYWYQTEPHRPSVRMPSYEDLVYGDWMGEVEVERGKYDLLTQIGSQASDAVQASPDDGSWSLYEGDAVLESRTDGVPGGIRRVAHHGFIDFSHVFNVRSNVSNVTWPANATTVAALEMPAGGTTTLHLSWAGGMKIRVNDEAVQDLGGHPNLSIQGRRSRVAKRGKHPLRKPRQPGTRPPLGCLHIFLSRPTI